MMPVIVSLTVILHTTKEEEVLLMRLAGHQLHPALWRNVVEKSLS